MFYATTFSVFAFEFGSTGHQIYATQRAPAPSLRPGFPHAGSLPGRTKPNTALLPACPTWQRRPAPPLGRSDRPGAPPQWPGKQHARRGHQLPPYIVGRVSSTSRPLSGCAGPPRCLQFPFEVVKYFRAPQRLKITRATPYDAQARATNPLPRRTGSRTTTKQEKRTMQMIHEKAIAFLLAVAISGTAFNTFIV